MQPYYRDNDVTLYHGDCRDVLPALPAASIDAVVCDPPYPCIERDYGTWTEDEWHALMRGIVPELRRVLTPTGSAVLILQANGERVGRMRPWLWEFLAWAAREWNIVQDAYWWNPTALPTAHAALGLLRPSVKVCVWLGPPDCYRNQDAVLWSESQRSAATRAAVRAGQLAAGRVGRAGRPSGHSVDAAVVYERAAARGGVTPFNLLPFDNSGSASGAADQVGHGGATPPPLCGWWVRYLTPPGGTVLDPFCGSGTVLRAAKRLGRRGIGVEVVEGYCRAAVGTLGQQMLPLAVWPEGDEPAAAPHAHRHQHFSPNEVAAKHASSGGGYDHDHEHGHPHHDWHAFGDADGHPTGL